MLDHVNIGLLGLGTVGTGVARTLLEKGRLLRERVGTKLVLKRVCVKDTRRRRGVHLPPGLITTDPAAVLGDKDIHIVVELIGGLSPARAYVLEAMRRRKHVVTANKALLAEHGHELFTAADRAGVDLYFEASVAGGIPIIKILREGLIGNSLQAIIGIVNGTSNYILTQMREKRLSFHDALREAKAHGYAERNPSLDVDGVDAAHKLAILALLGFGRRARLSDIHIEGIKQVTQADMQYVDELGYCIKPLVIAKREGRELELRVHPTLLSKSHVLANVSGVFNGIYVHGDLVGGQVFSGRGAGQNPTASAVISDIAEVARRVALGIRKRAPLAAELQTPLRLRRMGDIQTRYYLHFMAVDRPGVLARIATILGRHHISIASVNQKERLAARIAPVVMMTHEAREADIRKALRAIDEMPTIKAPTVVLRTEAPKAT